MEYLFLFGMTLLVVGGIGIAVGWLYMLGVMAYERDWWYFVPFFCITCIVVGFFTTYFAAKSLS